jgi:hypothetical protein
MAYLLTQDYARQPKTPCYARPSEWDFLTVCTDKLRRVVPRYRLANTLPEKRKYLRKSQLLSEDLTAKLFCNVEFRLELLPKLIGTC